jgi:hypothetical protein
MYRILFLSILFLGFFQNVLQAQIAYNPFTQNIHFAPEPTAQGFPCGTIQTVAFTQGLTTANNATQWQTEPLTVTICLGGFALNGAPTSAVSGSYAANFNWAYAPGSTSCIIGTQNQTLYGTGASPIFINPLSSGEILVSLSVPASSPVGTLLSVHVTLQVPAYMATFNSTPDDNESTQTQTFCGCYALTSPGLITGNQTFCGGGDPVEFTSFGPGSGGSGGTIQHQWQELISGVWTDIAGATSDVFNPPFTITNRIYRRNAKRSLCGNWIQGDSLQITIHPLPTADAGTNPYLNCSTTSASIGLPSVAGLSYSWSPNLALNDTSLAQPTTNSLFTQVYTLTVSDANNCSASDTLTVWVDNTPPLANTGNDKQLNCALLSDTIGSEGVIGNSYAWLPTTALSNASIAQPIASPIATTSYTLTVTGSNGCTAIADVVVYVDTTPPLADAGTDPFLNCSNTSTPLGTAAMSNYSYVWTPSVFLDATNNAQPISTPLQTTTYTVTVTGANGCTASDIVDVHVDLTLPVVDAGIDQTICFGDTTQIGSPAISNNTYSWLPANTLSDSNLAQPFAFPFVSTAYIVQVTGNNGCMAYDTVQVNVQFCPINLYGTVYKDTNALTNFKVDGEGIGIVVGEQLYMHLVNTSGVVIAITSVDSNGAYQFLNIAPNQNYTLVLSSTLGSIGTLPPSPDLPTVWVNTGEDCCDTTDHDGNPNGILSVNVNTQDVFFADFGIRNPLPTGFPLTLKNFNVIEYNCNAFLTWTSIQEKNTKHTEIYRKEINQTTFQKIAKIANAGNSDTYQTYRYTDKEVQQMMTYQYQLKFVDMDEQYTLSPIKSVQLGCTAEPSGIQIFPNPVTDQLRILYVCNDEEAILQFDILDMAGRKILSKFANVQHGENVLELDVQHLSYGTYILHYFDEINLMEGNLKLHKK